MKFCGLLIKNQKAKALANDKAIDQWIFAFPKYKKTSNDRANITLNTTMSPTLILKPPSFCLILFFNVLQLDVFSVVLSSVV